MAKSVFDAGHVDSQTRAGKRDGAFCATIRPGILPYVLLSYTHRLSDVFTLANMKSDMQCIPLQHQINPL